MRRIQLTKERFLRTALLCPGWPRALGAALRAIGDLGGEPALLLLPDRVADTWTGANERQDALPVARLSQAEVASGLLTPANRAASRMARIRRLVVFRNDGGRIDEPAAVRT